MAFYIWLFFENILLKFKFPYILFSKIFFRKLCRLRDNVGKYGRGRQATNDNIMRKFIACWLTKAKGIHLEHVTTLCFPWQKWLRERSSMLGYTHISSLVFLQLTGYRVIQNWSFCATERCRCYPTF